METANPEHITLGLGNTTDDAQVMPDRPVKDYLVGPKTSEPVAHGWTTESILFNHLDENVEKVMGKHMSSVAAVIVSRDRPSDRPSGADAIADALDDLKLASKEDIVVIPPTPKVGDPNAPILPHTIIIICNSVELKEKLTADPAKAVVHTTRKDGTDGFSFYLIPAFPEPSWFIATYVGISDRVTRLEFLSALFNKLIGDRAVIKMIQEHHDRVPEAPDIPFAVRVLLEYADTKPCQVWMPGRQGRAPERQNAIRLYMPTPSFNDAASKEFKDYLISPSFSFVVDCRGRAAPFRPARSGRSRPMECSECLGLDHYKDNCPIVTSPEFLAVHINDAELESVNVGYTLGSIGDRVDTAGPDGFKTVSYRAPRDRLTRGYGARFRGRGRGRARGRNL